MKKLIAMAAIAACGAIYAVESANVVGYTQKELAANAWYLVGCNFDKVGSTGLTVQDVVTGLTPGSDVSDSPMIEYWNGTELKVLIYVDSGAWDDDAGDFVTAWADPSELEAVKIGVVPSFGFWLKVPTAQTAMFSGEVVAEADYTKDIAATFDLVSNPYPVAFSFNGASFDCSGLTPGSDVSDSPMIEYWDGTELKVLILVDSGAWDDDAGDFVTAWADPSQLEAVKFQNAVGSGFWVKAASGATNQKIRFVK